jgi:hypothetical protein
MFAKIRMHKNGAMVLGKPMITNPAAEQKGFVFPIARTGSYISFSSDPMVGTHFIWTEKIVKVCHNALLSATSSSIVPERRTKGKKNLTMIR